MVHAPLTSFRSAAYFAVGDYINASQDADKCIQLRPKWAKGYFRKAAALVQHQSYAEGVAAYERGLGLEPANAAMKAARDATLILQNVCSEL